MPAIHRIKSALRPLLAATVLGAAGLAAATPAMAQPSFNFQLNIPGQQGGSVEFGFGNQGGGGWHNRDRWPGQGRCLSDREIRQGIGAYGYRDVRIGRELGRQRVQIQAINGPWVYSMRVDRCTGQVDNVRRERRAGGGWGGGGGNWGTWHGGPPTRNSGDGQGTWDGR